MRVRVGLRVARQEAPDEQAEVLVQLALGLGRDRVEHDRRLARPGHAREDRDLALGDAQRDVLEVVLAGASDLDVLRHGRHLQSAAGSCVGGQGYRDCPSSRADRWHRRVHNRRAHPRPEPAMEPRLEPRKTIGLVAHDNKKPDLVEWCVWNRLLLARHDLVATGTTGTLLEDELGVPVRRLQSGPLGGDQQLGALIAEGDGRLPRLLLGSARGAAPRPRRQGAHPARRRVEHPGRLQPGDRGLPHLVAADDVRLRPPDARLRDVPQPVRPAIARQTARTSRMRPKWRIRTATSTPNAARTRIDAAAIAASSSPPWNSA